MSTYSLAFVIGKYEIEDDDTGTPQSVYYPPTFSQARAQFALDESIKVLNKFGEPEDGFNIPFEDTGLTKLDSVGVSDFAAGGMDPMEMYFCFCFCFCVLQFLTK